MRNIVFYIIVLFSLISCKSDEALFTLTTEVSPTDFSISLKVISLAMIKLIVQSQIQVFHFYTDKEIRHLKLFMIQLTLHRFL